MKLSDLFKLVASCPICNKPLSLEKLEWGASVNLAEIKPGTPVQCWECHATSPAKSFNLTEVKP
jgi:hypothetical protein